jgi:hypothetical protein
MDVNSEGWEQEGRLFGNQRSSKNGADKDGYPNGKQKRVKLDIATPRQGLRIGQDKSPCNQHTQMR